MSKKITLYEFKRLPEEEQYEIIFNKGTFLDFSLDGNKRYALYAVDLFFVEVQYNSRRNEIVEKRLFKAGELLDKYSFPSNKI